MEGRPVLRRFVRRAAEFAGVTFGYVLMALVFTYPLILNFDSYIIGDMESDVWKHLWGMWWVRRAVVDECIMPLHTFLLNSPYGGALYFIDSLNAFISMPLQELFPIGVVFNLMVVFNIILAALGGYVLAKGLCGNRQAAFFAGGVYAFSAYMGASIASGITESINIGWLPFFCHYFIRMFRTSRYSDAVKAGLFFALNTLGCWYFGTFAVLFAVFYYVWLLWRRAGSGGRAALAGLWNAFSLPWTAEFMAMASFAAAAAMTAWYCPDVFTHLQVKFVSFRDWASWVVLPLSCAGSLLALLCSRPRRGGRFTALLLVWLSSGIVCASAGWMWQRFEWGWPCSSLMFFCGVCAGWAAVIFSVSVCTLMLRPRADSASEASGIHSLRGKGLPLLRLASALGLYIAVFGTVLAAVNHPPAWFREVLYLNLAVCVLPLFPAVWLWRRFLGRFAEVTSLDKDSIPVRWCAFSLRFFALLNATACLAVPLCVRLLPGQPSSALFMAWFILWLAAQAVLFVSLCIWDRIKNFCASELHIGIREIVSLWFSRYFKVPFVMVLVCAAAIAWPTLAFQSTINSDTSIVFRGRSALNVDLHLSKEFCNVVSLSDFFKTGKDKSIKSFTVDKLTRACYIGWTALIPAVWACFWGRPGRDRRFWLFTVLIFMMFACGPFMYINDTVSSTVKSPLYMFFFLYFPTFSSVSIPFRFTVLVMMGIGILAAYCLSTLFRGWNSGDRWLASAVLCASLLFENAAFSPSPYPLPLSEAVMPDYCSVLAAEKGDFSLIDIPIQRGKGELLPGEYFFYQIGHLKPLPNRVEGTIPLFVFQNALTSYLFILEHSEGSIPYRSRQELESGLNDLIRFRFRYLVVHNNYLRPDVREKIHSVLRSCCGKPQRFERGVDVYRLPAASDPAHDFF